MSKRQNVLEDLDLTINRISDGTLHFAISYVKYDASSACVTCT